MPGLRRGLRAYVKTKLAVNSQALTILDMDNLVDESLVCQLG